MTGPAWGLDPHDAITELLPNRPLARVLSSLDVPELNPNDPQPLFAPKGDFNRDKNEDIAISGIDPLSDSKTPYFLLIATIKKPGRFSKLYYREFARPVFVHKAGTTGQGDPGTQAFSLTLCSNCNEGWDVIWDTREMKFVESQWKEKTTRIQKIVTEDVPQVSSNTVDRALQIVGQLPDIQEFVAKMKKQSRAFSVRVERIEPEQEDRVRILIYEKSSPKNDLYEVMTLDINSGRITRRQKNTWK